MIYLTIRLWILIQMLILKMQKKISYYVSSKKKFNFILDLILKNEYLRSSNILIRPQKQIIN